MKHLFLFTAALLCLNTVLQAQNMKPEETEYWHDQPRKVTPGNGVTPPSDATILFDGKDFSKWVSDNGGEVKWKIEDGAMTVVGGTGGIHTKEHFGDCQLHIEFRSSTVIKGTSQGRGNSGIFLQSKYEVQVLDCYDNQTYSNGFVGSIYKQSAPLVDVCKKPGEWQTFDIIWTAPRFGTDGKLDAPAAITVFLNGVLVQNHFELKGTTPYTGYPSYRPAHGRLPLALQDHGNPVSFRNIWIRNL